MKRRLLFLVTLAIAIPFASKAQFEKLKDSVVQLYGVVMTADSLRAIPSVTVMIKGQNRGTITNEQGVFSIVVMKGDIVEFTSIGYKPKLATIPRELEGNQFSLLQLMVTDTVYLPATIIKPRPTKEQFERDFVNVNIPDDDIEIARKNTDESKRRVLARTLPRDGRESSNMFLRNNAQRYYYNGQTPPQNIFNPAAWAEFIQAWKRGDFKNQN
ncbi:MULTISPECIES: carboxypeptidase-like regulatory domain-containing protein [Niastella]|uniref:Carboxypeptidase-like regulatory domain-containing protein n=1 Tax=Niastella soli TaxID=2821487 RepID=A0ABS3YTI4_9BACT|nr:carboxypeptidase-like regulatory domain-containing protein [Niastella soli]MBO9201229.1 carboxypeptidase-like regulatory domain-containing protein [Niastella soli]